MRVTLRSLSERRNRSQGFRAVSHGGSTSLFRNAQAFAPSTGLLHPTHDRNSVEISTPTIGAVFRATLVQDLGIDHFLPRSDVETSTIVDRICWVMGGV